MADVPLCDAALARRLEAAEAAAGRSFVEARAEVEPGSGACWMTAGGATALFDGAASPITQTFGFGLFEDARPDDLAALETFYSERSAPVFHEVSPLADPSLLALFDQRGYHPVELTSVMFRPLDAAAPVPGPSIGATARAIGAAERALWTSVAADGWSDEPALGGFVRGLASVMAHRADTRLFLAEIDDRPAGAGALSLSGGVALFAGASTVPVARRRGAQSALLAERLRHAVTLGCDLAMICAQPGSPSQRNAERHGFRIAYTRIKWRRSSSEK